MTRLHIAAGAVALLAVLVYANAVHNGFALDDEFIVLRNPAVHGLERVDDALSSPYWPGAPGRIAMYRPVTSASFALEWDLWGADRPGGYHATNVLLHALVSVLVLLLLHALAGLWPAVAGAVLFAVHPVHVEAVANIVGRGELLAAAFFLAALSLYARAEKAGVGAAAAIGLLAFLAVGSKEIAVTLPAVLLIVEAVRPGAAGGWRGWVARSLERWPSYAAAVAGVVAYLAARIMVLDTALGNDPAPFLQGEGTAARIWTAVAVWPEYARLLLFPRDLVSDYSPGVLTAHGSLDPAVAAGLGVGLVATAVAALSWTAAPLIAAGVAWFAVVVLPISNLFFSIGIVLAERTLYLPSVGLSLAAAGLTRLLLERRRSLVPAVAGVGVLALLLLAGRTWTRTPTWASSEAVLATLAAEHPESFRVQWVMADRLFRAGRREEGLERFRLALSMMPAHYQLRFQYARALLGTGRLTEAAEQLELASRLIPEHAEAPILLAATLVGLEQWEEAVEVAEAAVARFPEHRGAWHQLALARGGAGDAAAALTARTRSLELAGPSAHWLQWVHLAELQLRLGQPDHANAALARARDRAPQGASVPTARELAAAVEGGVGGEGGGQAVLPYR